jgi:hypothetical protein
MCDLHVACMAGSAYPGVSLHRVAHVSYFANGSSMKRYDRKDTQYLAIQKAEEASAVTVGADVIKCLHRATFNGLRTKTTFDLFHLLPMRAMPRQLGSPTRVTCDTVQQCSTAVLVLCTAR